MTVREKLKSMFTRSGMFDSQAEKIMPLVMAEIQKSSPDGYQINWDAESDYPENLYHLWFFATRHIALKWIDENCPKAWYRALFDEKELEKIHQELIRQKIHDALSGITVQNKSEK